MKNTSSVNNKIRGKGIDSIPAQIAVNGIMIIVMILVLLPVFITLISSFKNNYDLMMSIWAFPSEWRFDNWAFGIQQILPNMINSIIIALVNTGVSIFIGSLSAFVFTRTRFIGKNFLYKFLILLMLVPSIITLTPLYILCYNLGVINSWFAIWFPGWAGGQVGSIFLFTTFFGQQPEAVYESARMDGAGLMTLYFRFCLPFSVPILCIQGISLFSSGYNDFMWPTIVIQESNKMPLMPVLKNLADVAAQQSQGGVKYAMYLLSSIPLIFTTAVGLKYFIGGEFASGLKI